MGASSSIVKSLHENQSGGFGGAQVPPEEQGQLVIPIQSLTRHLRLFQHCVSGEMLILVEQDISQVKEVTDTSEWYEVRISGLQQPYFESLTQTKFVGAPAPQSPRRMELAPRQQFKHLDPNSKTYAAAVLMAKALQQQGVKFPIGESDSDVPEKIIRPRPPPLLYPRPSENASQQNQSSDTGPGDIAAPAEDYNRERDAAEVKAQLEPQFGHDFDITPHVGAGGRAGLRVVCRACLEEVEEGRAAVGGWGRQMAMGGPVLTAFALNQLTGEGKYGQDSSPRQKVARSDRGGHAQWREVLSQHRLSCMSSLHLSDRLRELDLHLRPVIASLTACNFDMMFGQMSRAIRIFEDKCAINNFVLTIVRRVVDVQLVPKGFLIPSAGALLRKVDAVVDDINELVAVMRRWLSGGGAAKVFNSGRLPSIFTEPPPPIDHELEMELIRHVDVLVDTLEVAQQKKQILQNFKLSNVSLSSFRFVRKLGRGAFASVYLAKRGANYVVLKTMSKAHVRERGMAGQVILEQRVLRASSRSQPQLFVLFAASFQTRSRLFLALEYVPGGDCASLLASMPKGFIPEPTARLIAGEVAYAVKHMHDHGIVHRDIKPDNILITATGHIKLTDFGMASPRDRKQNRHAAHGPGTSSSETHSSDYSYGGESFGAQVYGLHDKVPQWLDLYGGFRRNIVALSALNLNRGDSPLGGSPAALEVMMQVQGTADSSASDIQSQSEGQGQGQGLGQGLGQGQGQGQGQGAIHKLIAPPKFKTVAGNYHYAAPESIQRHVCGHEVDWWALGVLLYQFLTGLLPFADPPDPTRERDSPAERASVMARILAGKPHMKELPTSTASAPYTYNRNDLLQGLWVRDPNHRLGHLSGSHVLNHAYFRESPTAIPTPASLRQLGPLMLQIGGPGDTSYYPPEADSFEQPSWWPSEASDDAAIMAEDAENKESEFPSYTTVGSLA